MSRFLMAPVLAYAGLTASYWGHLTRITPAPPGTLRCGNVLIDPLNSLLNVIGPAAAACVILLVRRSAREHRWRATAIAALVTFAATSASLAWIVQRLCGDFGLPLCSVWWMPWR